MNKLRERERKYVLTESELKRLKVFHEAEKEEVVQYTTASEVKGYVVELMKNPIGYAKGQKILDDVSGLNVGMHPCLVHYIRSYVAQNM